MGLFLCTTSKPFPMTGLPSHWDNASMPFVVFEGLDGAGKSTLIASVKAAFQSRSLPAQFVQDPGTTPLGKELRQLIVTPGVTAPGPLSELLMYQAARSEMVEQVIRPHLKEKDGWVFSDRFYSSTLAFQVTARGLDESLVRELNKAVAEGCHPDLFVFIDITLEERERRLNQRAQNLGEERDRMEQEPLDFHRRVREGYLRQARQDPNRWLVLDGACPPQDLFHLTMKELSRRGWL